MGTRQDDDREKECVVCTLFIDRLPQPGVCSFLSQLVSEANTALYSGA